MKYLKLFEKFNSLKIYESGFKSKEIESKIKKDIIKYLSRFEPNIDEPEDSPHWIHNNDSRKLNPSVSLNDGKYGIVCDISFPCDIKLDLQNINKELLFIHNELYDIVSDYFYPKFPTLSKFEFFGHKISGQKNGRTLEIEDIREKADELVEKLMDEPLVTNYNPVLIQFTIK
jgi:hypothetical protein